jgi:hypothetical protein
MDKPHNMRKSNESGMTITSLSKYLQDRNNDGANDNRGS